MKMETLKESHSLEYVDIDPYDEEDWDEYEIKSGDILYLFFNKGPTVDAGIAETKLQGDKVTLDVKKFVYDSIKPGDTMLMNENIKKDINDNQISAHKQKVKGGTIMATVNDFKFGEKLNKVHEIVRTSLFDKVKNMNKSIQNDRLRMIKIEDNVIKMKSELKSDDEFPDFDKMKLKDNEYVVIKLRKTSTDPVKITIKTMICYEGEKDSDGGTHLINRANNERPVYLLKTLEKLKKNKFLQLKPETSNNDRTFVTNDKNIYLAIVDHITNETNKEIRESIDNMRAEYRKIKVEVDKKIKEYDYVEQSYMDFNFEELIKKFKDVIESYK